MNFEKSFFNRGVSDREQSGKAAVSHPVADLINLQVGAAGQYSITDNWRVAPSILALCKTGCSVDISADVQYLFNIAPDWHIYPLAGISANDIGDWSCGINLGGGADFSITRNWDVSAGFKWMIQTAKDYVPGFVKRRNPIVINIGATYRF